MIVNVLDSSFFLVGDSVQIYGVAVCVPAVIIFFILAYVIIKEWVKRLK